VEPCPVEAIYAEDDLPSEWKDFARINRMYFEDRDGARALVEAWASRQ
jgi:hypothetical protein